MEQLRMYYLFSAARNHVILSRLEQIVRLFAARGIPVVLLKGAALLSLVYQDLALRPMADVDLLVRREDLQQAANLLCEMGLSPRKTRRSPEDYETGHHHWVPFASPDGLLVVELHRTIVPPRAQVGASVDDLWRRAEPIRLGTATVLTLCPSDLLLHLCIHASCNHLFTPSLRCVYDLSLTASSLAGTIDWPNFIESARAWNAGRYVYCCLWLVQTLMPAPVPGTVIAAVLPPSALGGIERRAMRGLALHMVLRPEQSRPVPSWLLQVVWDQVVGPLGPAGKAAIVWAALWRGLVESARLTFPGLPKHLLVLYAALLHPLYLSGRAADSWAKRRFRA
jgi:hypothetical protein